MQVKNQQGQWISADPISGTFVCNIGDMLKVQYKWSCCDRGKTFAFNPLDYFQSSWQLATLALDLQLSPGCRLIYFQWHVICFQVLLQKFACAAGLVKWLVSANPS